MKTPHQQRVEQFMTLARQEVPEKPTVPSEEVRKLRAKLILEEAFETVRELGFKYTYFVDCCSAYDNAEIGSQFTQLQPILNHVVDLSKLAKESADLSVVNTGTLSACGIHDADVLKAVDENNLNKFGPGHSYREDGKLLPPPGFKKSPDMQLVLDNQEGEF